MRRLRNEHGIALPLAVFSLVVITGLVGGALFVATQEQRIGRNTLRQEAAFTAAEAGMQDAVLHWSTHYQTLSIGTTIRTTATAPDGRGWYRRTIRRLGPMVFLVASEGFTRDSTSRSRVGALLRLQPLEFNFNAALKTQGTTRVGGSSEISGHDSIPTGWTGCPPAAPEQPGIRMSDTTDLSTNGNCSGEACITGSPKVMEDTTINTQTLSSVGDIPFDSLEQYATKVVSGGSMQQVLPSTTGIGACDTGDQYNWGDPVNPTGPCGGYFPIVYSDGDLTLGSGYGQGVLIVNGNLTVNGGFTFYGPVLVSGTLSTAGNGGHFNGGVIAANTDLCDTNSCATSVMGNALVSYSSCALTKALTGSATAGPLLRSWVDLY